MNPPEVPSQLDEIVGKVGLRSFEQIYAHSRIYMEYSQRRWFKMYAHISQQEAFGEHVTST